MSLSDRSKSLRSRLSGNRTGLGPGTGSGSATSEPDHSAAAPWRETRAAPPHAPEPDFLCIGAQKGGTRWLYDAFASRDDVWLPPIKELHYFDGEFRSRKAKVLLDRRLQAIWQGKQARRPDLEFLRRAAFEWGKGRDFDWYGRLFDVSPLPTTGDVTPAYSTLDKDQIAAISARFPRLKVILLVRHPVDRFWSQVSMFCRLGKWDPDQMTDPDKVVALLEDEGVRLRSLPSETIDRWSTSFHDDRFAVYLFDDIRTQPAEVLAQSCQFLGLDPDPERFNIAPDTNRKANRDKLDMNPAVRAALYEYFSDELDRCVDRFGGPTLQWERS